MSDTDAVDLVRASAERFASSHRDFAALRAGRNSAPWKGAGALTEMAELGWLGTLIPEEFGGIGLDLSAIAAIARELGKSLQADSLVALAVLAPLAVLHGSNHPLKEALLPQLAEGSEFAALAWQETGTTIRNPFAGAALLREDGGKFVLDGEKRFVAGAWAATRLVVLAQGASGPVLCLISPDQPGVSIAQEWRADGSPAGRVSLVGVRLEPANILATGDSARTALEYALNCGAIVASAELVGAMSGALDMTLDYMRTRVAFGRPISSFQALQHRASEMYVVQQRAEGVLTSALKATEAVTPAALKQWSSRCKARCNEAAMEITRQGIQLHGAIGFTDECDIGLYLKRSLVLSAWLGTTRDHHGRIEPYGALASEGIRSNGPSVMDDILSMAVEQRDWNGLSDEQFRFEFAQFFARNVPQQLRFRPGRLGWSEIKDWYLFLSKQGLLAPSWETKFGGMGLSPSKHLIYYEEMERVGAPRLLDHGINNVGSILIARGTDAQRAAYLPKILSGEHIWCQGYSEPNAGSDLAGLRTEARIEGDELVISGQKIWTTLAHEANHMYALVRTDKSRPGRDGISFVLLDLRQPGITIRRIRNIAGHEEFCEVFLDDVRTSISNLVGELNDGWAVSTAVLGFERLRVGAPRNSQLALQRLIRGLKALSLERDPLWQDLIVRFTCDVDDLGALYERAGDALAAGTPPGPEASILKILATRTEQDLCQALVEAGGDLGSLAGAMDLGSEQIDLLGPFLSTRATTIYGGTNEIQLNIIARRVLKL